MVVGGSGDVRGSCLLGHAQLVNAGFQECACKRGPGKSGSPPSCRPHRPRKRGSAPPFRAEALGCSVRPFHDRSPFAVRRSLLTAYCLLLTAYCLLLPTPHTTTLVFAREYAGEMTSEWRILGRNDVDSGEYPLPKWLRYFLQARIRFSEPFWS